MDEGSTYSFQVTSMPAEYPHGRTQNVVCHPGLSTVHWACESCLTIISDQGNQPVHMEQVGHTVLFWGNYSILFCPRKTKITKSPLPKSPPVFPIHHKHLLTCLCPARQQEGGMNLITATKSIWQIFQGTNTSLEMARGTGSHQADDSNPWEREPNYRIYYQPHIPFSLLILGFGFCSALYTETERNLKKKKNS